MENSITLKFLNKEVSLPSDIREYQEILRMTLSAHQNMFDLFAEKVLKTERKAIEDEELISILEIEAAQFVKRLCTKGVFSQTVNDYIFGIAGHSEVLATNQRALQATFNFLREEVLGFIQGVEDAERTAQSKVTGSGISVWSNSFTTLASFAALDYFSAKGQIKKASAEYKQEIQNLEKYGKSKTERKSIEYLKTHYFPEMEQALSVFAFGMMDKYLNTLIAEKQFDEGTLQYVDFERSTDLLNNLKLSSSVNAILENAFIACPFNVKTFIKTAELNKLNDNILQVIHDLDLTTELREEYKSFLKKATESEPNHHFAALLTEVAPLVELLSKVEKQNTETYYKELSNNIRQKIIEKYNHIKSIYDAISAQCILAKLPPEKIPALTPEQLPAIVSQEINSIVSQNVFDLLITQCGHTTLLLDISPDGDCTNFKSKSDLDSYYISHIVTLLTKNFNDLKIALTNQHKSPTSSGCYVATCVYGSYDCPSVWTLRRYRDYHLANSWCGRLFIRIYYAISPKIVKHFGHMKCFKSFWKKKLDKFVNKLQAKGFASSPYDDKKW